MSTWNSEGRSCRGRPYTPAQSQPRGDERSFALKLSFETNPISCWPPELSAAWGSRVHRVVVTGLGIVAPNATGIPEFTKALREARSGVTFQPRMNELRLACQVAGTPHIDPA